MTSTIISPGQAISDDQANWPVHLDCPSNTRNLGLSIELVLLDGSIYGSNRIDAMIILNPGRGNSQLRHFRLGTTKLSKAVRLPVSMLRVQSQKS